MRSVAFALACGLALSFVTQVGKAGQPPTLPPPETAPQAKALPIPDGPVVKKQELEGGLIAEDIKIGEGAEVKPGAGIVAHYHGTIKDGNEFDSSYRKGEPMAVPLSAMIPGWQKGLPGMKVGGIRRLTIPAALGWGDRSPDPKIPANSDLVFIVEIIAVLEVEDITVGTGEVAEANCVPVTSYVIKDKDGKEIEKSDANSPYIWLPGEYQPIQLGVEGMKVGGKRKLTVPKEMNVSPPEAGANRPQQVPVTIEIELIAVRNDLPGKRRR